MTWKQFGSVAAFAGVLMVGAGIAQAQWSVTNLNPAGLTQTVAYAAGGGQQAGYARVGDEDHASLWSGTADSWVDLNPAGSILSFASAVNDGQQVGYANVGGVERASLWSGTASSWVDLHTYLPTGFLLSQATGISSDGVNTYVAGYGYNSLTNRIEALLWTRPIPTPGVAGLLGLGGVVALRRRRGVGR